MMELKPCPMCGKADSPALILHADLYPYWDDEQPDSFAVMCDASDGYGCGATGGFRETEAEATKAWNRRAESDLLAALKELAASVDGITVGETCEEEQRVSKAWQAAHAAIARHE